MPLLHHTEVDLLNAKADSAAKLHGKAVGSRFGTRRHTAADTERHHAAAVGIDVYRLVESSRTVRRIVSDPDFAAAAGKDRRLRKGRFHTSAGHADTLDDDGFRTAVREAEHMHDRTARFGNRPEIPRFMAERQRRTCRRIGPDRLRGVISGIGNDIDIGRSSTPLPAGTGGQ